MSPLLWRHKVIVKGILRNTARLSEPALCDPPPGPIKSPSAPMVASPTNAAGALHAAGSGDGCSLIEVLWRSVGFAPLRARSERVPQECTDNERKPENCRK